MMLLRANVIAKGLSGARPELIDLLTGMLNSGLWPPIPEQGSVGASGDLAPLAHSALSLIGEGTLSRGDQSGPALDMLRASQLTALTLQPKEGITLINGTQAHTAIAALALVDAERLWMTAHVAGAMTLEGLLGTPVAFDERIHAARGQLGQVESATLLRALLARSEIRESHSEGDRRVARTRRAPAPRSTAVLCHCAFAGRRWRELNAATDNPLVFDNGEMLSGGNFHGQAVALALDVLAIALTNLATIAERRIDRLVNPDLNEGLPPFLTSDAGVSSGLMMAQVTAAALASECKVLVASGKRGHDSHRAADKEDVVPMAMTARVEAAARGGRNVRATCWRSNYLRRAGHRLPVAAAARAGRRDGARRVRTWWPTLDRDRSLAPDIAILVGRDRRGCVRSHRTELPSRTACDFCRRARAPPRAPAPARESARPAADGALVQGLAAGSRAAHADEQPRPRGRRAARRSRRLRRHRQGGAQLGGVRRHRRARSRALERRRDAARAVGKPVGVFRTHRGRAARAHRQLEPRRPVGDVGGVPRARGARADDVRPDDGRLVDLHRHAGHPAGHVRDVRRGARQHFGGTLAGRLVAHRPASAAWAARSRSRRR